MLASCRRRVRYAAKWEYCTGDGGGGQVIIAAAQVRGGCSSAIHDLPIANCLRGFAMVETPSFGRPMRHAIANSALRQRGRPRILSS